MGSYLTMIAILAQTQTRVQFQWPYPGGWIIFIGVVLIASVFFNLRSGSGRWSRKLTLISMRVLAITVIAVMLSGWSSHEEITGKPKLIVLVDVTASMGLEDQHPTLGMEGLDHLLFRELGWDVKTFREYPEVPVGLDRSMLAKAFVTGGEGVLTPEELASGYKLRGVLKGIESDYDVQMYEFNTNVKRIAFHDQRGYQPGFDNHIITGPGSAIGDAIAEVLKIHRGQSIAGIVLLSDGLSNKGISLQRAGEIASQYDVPIIVPGVIGTHQQDDFHLSNPSGPTMAYVDEPIELAIDVTRLGNIDEQAELTFWVTEDQQKHEKVVSFEQGQSKAKLSIDYSSSMAGAKSVLVELSVPEWREYSSKHLEYWQTQTHQFDFVVEDDAINVLLIDQYPRFEFRALEDLLTRTTDSTGRLRFDVSTVLGSSDPQLAEQDSKLYTSLPESRDWLNAFDVVVLGDVSPDLLPLDTQDRLADYAARRGGGIAFIAGEQHLPSGFEGQPLAALFPASVENFESSVSSTTPGQLTLSRLGLQSSLTSLHVGNDENAALWSQLEGPYWHLQSTVLKPGSRVLLFAESESDGRVPLVTQRFFGAGRVVFHGFDSTWRWQDPRETTEYGDAYARYWIQLMRYLAGTRLGNGEKGVELSATSEHLNFGEDAEIHVRYLDPLQAPAEEDVVVQLTTGGGNSKLVRLGRDSLRQGLFSATIGGLRRGSHTVELVSSARAEEKPQRLKIFVGIEDRENMFVGGDKAALQSLASQTGGKYYEPREWDRIKVQLPKGRRVVVQELNIRLLWNSNWLILIFVSAISLEWWLRRRWYN